MKDFIFYILIFVLVYLFYIIFVLNRKNVLKKFATGRELSYLKFKYSIKVYDKNIKELSNLVFLANSFILSITVYIICLFNNLFLQIFVGILTLIILILSIYHLIGTYYKKKQGGK